MNTEKTPDKPHIANRDQDPNHPANKTPASTREPAPRSAAEGFSIPAADMLTEQEKAAAGGGEGAGVGPITAAEHTTGPVETIEDQGIGPRTPYPTGNPPPDSEVITRSQGIIKPGEPHTKVEPGKPP